VGTSSTAATSATTLGPQAAERLEAVERATRLARQIFGDTAQYRAIARYLVGRVLEEWPADETRDRAVDV
jgi:hypothetical protein